MLNESTEVLEIPYNLSTLSQATNNPMLDLGYQCCDMRPYFEYSDGTVVYYTTVHPTNIASQKINVYEKTTKNVDGENYSAMTYVGTTTSADLYSIVYNDTTYTYQNKHENIRGFYINKWAKYKPIQSEKESELIISEDNTIDEFVKNNCGLDLALTEVPTSGATNYDNLIESMLDDMNNGRFKWIYRPPSVELGNWFRMTDFIGYNRKAKNPFYMEYPRGIGPTIDGIKEVYLDTKEDTATVKILIGEYKKSELPINNITSDCLPRYFKKDNALGVIYSSSNGFEFVDPVDGSGMFKYPLVQGKSVEIPINIRIGNTYNIGAYLVNKDSGDSGYYLPVKPLNLKFLKIPDIVKIEYWGEVSNTKDLVIKIKVTRNGNTWWWGVHRPNDYIYGIRTVTNVPAYSDHPFICWIKKNRSAEYINSGNDSPEERKLIKDNIEYTWNGYSEINTQLGVINPIQAVPQLYNTDYLFLEIRFVELKDVIVPMKNSIDDIYIEGNLLIDVDGNRYQTKNIRLDKEIFEDVGWI